MAKIFKGAQVLVPALVILGGCASLSNNVTTYKSATAICATTGAALQAMHTAKATSAIEKAKPYATALRPLCNSTTPASGITATEYEAFTELTKLARPYIIEGGTK